MSSASGPTLLVWSSSPNRASLGRNAPRSRKGCWTCRGRAAKKRCDEQRPVCGRCARMGLSCDYSSKPKKARVSSVSTISSPASEPPTLPSPQPAANEAACSLTLAGEDHDAIHFFRTAFAKFHHTKHPSYGCISIMFNLAQEDPVIMHMVLALGFGEMDTRRTYNTARSGWMSKYHHSAALRLLAEEVAKHETNQDLDSLLTTLWLLLLYAQQFGNSKDLSIHLKGAASLVEHRLEGLTRLATLCPSVGLDSEVFALTRKASRSRVDRNSPSLYSVRMLVWIAHIDSAAAISGLSGEFNTSLLTTLSGQPEPNRGEHDTDWSLSIDEPLISPSSSSPVDVLLSLHRYSNPLYRLQWADNYPQAQLLDDIENRSVFNLFTCCSPLRFMVAELAVAATTNISPHEFHKQAAEIAKSIQKINASFAELLGVAGELSIEINDTNRLATNIRNIVPIYYATQLEFLYVTDASGKSQRKHGKKHACLLKEIMRLAFQTFRHTREEGLTRIAWALFVAALETEDVLHRAWILERFEQMASFGHHLSLAHGFLKDTFASQEGGTGNRVDPREMLKNYEPFILA